MDKTYKSIVKYLQTFVKSVNDFLSYFFELFTLFLSLIKNKTGERCGVAAFQPPCLLMAD